MPSSRVRGPECPKELSFPKAGAPVSVQEGEQKKNGTDGEDKKEVTASRRKSPRRKRTSGDAGDMTVTGTRSIQKREHGACA